MGKRGINIYHRKDGRWEGRYKDGFNVNGKPKYHSVYAHTYNEVKETLLKIKASKNKSFSLCSLTVKQLFYEWLNMKKVNVKESTIANYSFKIEKHLLAFFGSLKFNKLSPKLVYDFIQKKRSENLSEKYIADMIIILKSMAKYTAKTYHCSNEISDIQLPKVAKSELNLYTKEQQKILKYELLRNTNNSSIKKGDYYDVKIEIPEGIISIWVSDDVNPEHPMFEIFDNYIENDKDAENFNEKDIIGCPIKFKLKLVKLTDTSHYFFEYIQINEEEIE